MTGHTGIRELVGTLWRAQGSVQAMRPGFAEAVSFGPPSRSGDLRYSPADGQRASLLLNWRWLDLRAGLETFEAGASHPWRLGTGKGNLSGGRDSDRLGLDGVSLYRCYCGSIVCDRISRVNL